MKKILVLFSIFYFSVLCGVFGVIADDVEQNATVNISEQINISLNPPNVDFGLLYPGSSKSINVTVDNSNSNVNVTVNSVGLLNGGTLFDGLLFNGQTSGSFVPLDVDAWGTGLIVLTLNVPEVIEPGPQGDTIVYTITGPTP